MQTSLDLSSLSRRDALKAGLIFSTGLLAGNWTSRAAAAEPEMDFGKDGLHFLAVGDYGSGGESQRLVARRMNEFAGTLGSPLTAVLALGDNFYNKLETERFAKGFEEMYSKEHLDCPFYATLGNHDYGPGYDSKQGAPKADIQLAYAKDNPTSRWKMPAKWYTVEFPNAVNPLVKIIYLDSNLYEEGMMTPQEKLDQKRFLEAELAKERKAKWLWVVAHHPVFTDTIKRKDSTGLIKNWGQYLQQNPVSLYLSGHDHNLQHLRQPDYSASFLVSGGGGAKSYETKLSDRGFSKTVYGFNHIHVNHERIKVQIIDMDGKCLHAFTRDMAGKMEITV